MSDRTDVELVRQFRSGDPDAFTAIVQRFQDRVFRLASVWLHDPQQALDATQEVFMRAFRGLRKFGYRAAPFTWLYRATRNVCNEFNRKRRMEPLGEEPVDVSASPHRHIVAQDTAARVRALVAELPMRQRDVVLLRVFEELSVADTARAMGCRQGTVKALLYKATRHLRIDFEKAGLSHE